MAQGSRRLPMFVESNTGKVVVGDGNDYEHIGLPAYTGDDAQMVVAKTNGVTGRLTFSGVPVNVVDGLVFNDSSPEAWANNSARIQKALDLKGRVEIHYDGDGIGDLYFRAPVDQTYVKGVSARQPSVLQIDSDTHFIISENVRIRPAGGAGTFYSAFLSNKAFMEPRASVINLTVGSKSAGLEVREVTMTLSRAINVSAGEFVCLRGDSVYGWDGVYRCVAVDVPGAATSITFNTWKDDAFGLNVYAGDEFIAYPATGNVQVEIRGPATQLANLTNANPGQGERAFMMFNKIGAGSSFSIFDFNHGHYGKLFAAWNHYDLQFPKIVKRNVGAGVCLFGPGRSASIGYIYGEGGEDNIILQNCSNNASVSMGAQDSDGYQASGSIRGTLVVDDAVFNRCWQRGFGVYANGDLNNPSRPLRIDGIHVKSLRARVSGGGAVGFVSTDGLTTHPAASGGYPGLVRIDRLYFEDAGLSTGTAPELFNFNTTTQPSDGLYWEGLSIGHLEIVPSDVGPAMGLRGFIASVGNGATAASPLTIGQITVESCNIMLDAQHMSGAPRMLNIPNYVTIEKLNIDTGRVRGALTLQNPAPSSAGTGYAVGDILTVAGGTRLNQAAMRVRVESVDGSGAVTGLSVENRGAYATLPSSPASVSGGTGSGLTITWTNTIWSWNIWLPGSTNSGIKNVNLGSLDVEYPKNGANRVGSIGRGGNGVATSVSMNGGRYDLYSLFNLSSPLTLSMVGTDLSSTQYNVSQGSCANNTTVTVNSTGVRYAGSQPVISPNANQVSSGGVINIYSSGNNQHSASTNALIKPTGGNTGLTVNLYGNVTDFKSDFALAGDYVFAPKSGAMFWNTNAAYGAGAGLYAMGASAATRIAA